jgi:hypothetical protein
MKLSHLHVVPTVEKRGLGIHDAFSWRDGFHVHFCSRMVVTDVGGHTTDTHSEETSYFANKRFMSGEKEN